MSGSKILPVSVANSTTIPSSLSYRDFSGCNLGIRHCCRILPICLVLLPVRGILEIVKSLTYLGRHILLPTHVLRWILMGAMFSICGYPDLHLPLKNMHYTRSITLREILKCERETNHITCSSACFFSHTYEYLQSCC